MKRATITAMSVALVLIADALALGASGYYAITSEIGYQGTVWNVTDGTGPWTTTSPRDGYLYSMMNYAPFGQDYNYLLSNWSEHSVSNTNNSFLQLADNGESVIGASGGWDSTLKTFTATVTGADAPYPWSRFWQPDNGVAWGVTLTDYSYTFTATFPSEAAIDSDGWLSNTTDPDTITGSFTGHFVVTADVNKNPITNGDTYGFDIAFSKDLFVPLDTLDAYGTPTSVSNYFGAAVPEPASLIVWSLLSIGGIGAAWRWRRR